MAMLLIFCLLPIGREQMLRRPRPCTRSAIPAECHQLFFLSSAGSGDRSTDSQSSTGPPQQALLSSYCPTRPSMVSIRQIIVCALAEDSDNSVES